VTPRIRFTFPAEQVSADAELLWDQVPKICAAITEVLPCRGTVHHGIYSGSECVLLLEEVQRLARENATAKVTRGEVAFTWMVAGSSYGVNSDFAEICWFYDIDAEARMWEGPSPVVRPVIEPDEFHGPCRRMRREGVKPCHLDVAR